MGFASRVGYLRMNFLVRIKSTRAGTRLPPASFAILFLALFPPNCPTASSPLFWWRSSFAGWIPPKPPPSCSPCATRVIFQGQAPRGQSLAAARPAHLPDRAVSGLRYLWPDCPLGRIHASNRTRANSGRLRLKEAFEISAHPPRLAFLVAEFFFQSKFRLQRPPNENPFTDTALKNRIAPEGRTGFNLRRWPVRSQ